MEAKWSRVLIVLSIFLTLSCEQKQKVEKPEQLPKNMTAKEILGNKKYQAISYGGYRQNTRNLQPTVEQLKEDLKLLYAMDIRVLRTYNVQLAHASNLLKAISEIKNTDREFEMYVMLGAWIDCKNAWTALPPDHNEESEKNAEEIARAVALANQYPDIVKVIAVGNEAMVKWADSYYVQPGVVLKWVNHLQELKKSGELSKDLWITSSDNFASWGGGGSEYHVEDLNELIKAVDFISMHTYPMHDTHYNPVFWGNLPAEDSLSANAKIELVMERTISYARSQYNNVKAYMKLQGVEKPIHIGETGWATAANDLYGDEGSKATDEYKAGVYYRLMRDWTNKNRLTCFYFEAFDEPWKDAQNPGGSENYFGLFTLEGKAKYAIWEQVDNGAFQSLGRGGNPVTKTYNGEADSLMKQMKYPPVKKEMITSH